MNELLLLRGLARFVVENPNFLWVLSAATFVVFSLFSYLQWRSRRTRRNARAEANANVGAIPEFRAAVSYFPLHGNGIAIDWRRRKLCLKLDSGLHVYSCGVVIEAEVRTRVELHVERSSSSARPEWPAAAGQIHLNVAIRDGADITTARIRFLDTTSALQLEDYQMALRHTLLVQALIGGPLGHKGDVLEVRLAQELGDLVESIYGDMDYYRYLNFIALNPALNKQPAGGQRTPGNFGQELLREAADRLGEIERVSSRPEDLEALSHLEGILADPRGLWFVKNAAAAALHTIGTVRALNAIDGYRNEFVSQCPTVPCMKCNGTRFWFDRWRAWQCCDCDRATLDAPEVNGAEMRFTADRSSTPGENLNRETNVEKVHAHRSGGMKSDSIRRCSRCDVKVLPTANGLCPSCGGSM